MSYLVLARKWRPKTFEQVVGQQHVLRALINGLEQNRLHHAFLFAGTRGVGKTTLARILAKSLNCEKGVTSQPCGECQSCIEVDAGRFVDLIEVDAASRTKVDDTRELLDNVQYAPTRGRYKVYLIDEVHMLSTSSFNALLKTLEEPPPHVKFLLATTDPQKLPVTILSRCLQFNLRRLNVSQISEHLAFILEAENIPFEIPALQQIARAADGSMRDALSLMDQAIGFCGDSITTEQVHDMLGNVSPSQILAILVALANKDAHTLLQQATELYALGRNVTVMLDGLLDLLQQLAVLQAVSTITEDEATEISTTLATLANELSPETVQLLYQIALHGKRDLPYAADPQSGFEMTLLRMLSFQPHQLEVTPPLQATATKKSSRAVKAAPETASTPSTPLPSVIEIPLAEETTPVVDLNKPIINVTERVTPSSAPINGEPTVVTEKPIISQGEFAESTSISEANWTQLISGLKLSALTRQLADNCAFVHAENQHITLSLSNELAHLATPRTKQRFSDEISDKLGYSVQLHFDMTAMAMPATQTLAAERAQNEADKLQKAIDSIENDPVVEVIKNTFNARIIENTIKPLD